MLEFAARLIAHAEHVKKVGTHCNTEETTKQALILPLLEILGYNPYDPTKVRAEYAADMPGVKASERVDYVLYFDDNPVMFIEAKSYGSKLSNHEPQLSRYFNATPSVTVSAITNGREWRFFTDLENRNIMDTDPFLVVNFEALKDGDATQLYRFRHDQIKPAELREIAEQAVYLSAFKAAIARDLAEPGPDVVKYLAGRSGINRQLTGKFIEGITPIVREAVAQVIGEMVTSGLSARAAHAESVPVPPAQGPADPDPYAEEINGKIITTREEKRLFAICLDILSNADIAYNDTETYFSVLYQGKSNRWLLRFHGDRKTPTAAFGIDLTDQHKAEITRSKLELLPNGHIAIVKPENLYRLTGLLHDALAYCQNDDNFKRKPNL